MADFLGGTLQGILNPRAPDISRGVGAAVQGYQIGQQRAQQEAQRQQQQDLLEAGSQALSVLDQPPEMRQQALSGLLTQAQESGDADRAQILSGLMQMDSPTLDARLKQFVLQAGNQLPAGALKSASPEKFGRVVAGEDAQGNPVFAQVGTAGTLRTVEGFTPTSAEQKATEAELISKGREAGKQKVRLETEPEIQGAILRSKSQAEKAEKRSEKVNSKKQLDVTLDRFDKLLKDGIYTGSLSDQSVKGLADFGIVFDQGKLNRTTRARQIATNLKFMAKPSGMGAMSDSEWQIVKDAIPDPESATIGQIQAGLEEFRARLNAEASDTPSTQVQAEAIDVKTLSDEDLFK